MSNIRVDLVESESGSLDIRRTRMEVLGGEYSKCRSLRPTAETFAIQKRGQFLEPSDMWEPRHMGQDSLSSSPTSSP